MLLGKHKMTTLSPPFFFINTSDFLFALRFAVGTCMLLLSISVTKNLEHILVSPPCSYLRCAYCGEYPHHCLQRLVEKNVGRVDLLTKCSIANRSFYRSKIKLLFMTFVCFNKFIQIRVQSGVNFDVLFPCLPKGPYPIIHCHITS